MKDCEICGNPISILSIICPYCKEIQKSSNKGQRGGSIRELNLEKGMPSVKKCLVNLNAHLNEARQDGILLLRLIHGYGSTGNGGALRDEVRKYISKLQAKGKIKNFIKGEDYHVGTLAAENLQKRFPKLKERRLSDANNDGIIYVEL